MKWHHTAWLRAIERRLPYQIALMHSGDCALVSAVLEQERFASVRKAQRKISVMYKIFVPAKRVADALNALERAGKLTSNGHLRTYGREVNEGGYAARRGR